MRENLTALPRQSAARLGPSRDTARSDVPEALEKNDDDDGNLGVAAVSILGALLGSATAGDDTESPSEPTLYADYPYAPGARGFVEEDWATREGRGPDLQTMAMVAQLDVSATLTGVARGRGGVRVFLEGPLELDTSWAYYWDPVSAEGINEATLGDLHLNVRLVETAHTMVRIGVGYRGWLDTFGHQGGIEGLVGGEPVSRLALDHRRAGPSRSGRASPAFFKSADRSA